MNSREFTPKEKDVLEKTGLDLSEKERVASFVQRDDEVLVSKSYDPGIEMLSIEEALSKYQWVKDLYGKTFRVVDKDFPRDTYGGYFIWIKKGVQVFLPIQACLFLKKRKFSQRVHNIIVAEEGSRAYIITGCAASPVSEESYHLGISEFFVKKGAYLNFTMIHSWKEDIESEPKTIALVEEKGVFLSNYICLRPVRKITMYPTVLLLGKEAKARFNSLLFAHPKSFLDVGSRIIFRAPLSSGEIISRVVSEEGEIITRGHLKAESPKIKAHLECRGLMLSSYGKIWAVPELETLYQDVDMSHEAAIGKISKDEIEYLASRGLNQEEAKSIIIRGFMDTEILALPQVLKSEIERITQEVLKSKL